MWNENEKRPVWQYLILTFGIAWVLEGMIILGEQLGILTGKAGSVMITAIIFLGAGCAPAYAMLILLKKYKQINGFKDFVKRILHTNNVRKTILVTLVFMAAQVIMKAITSPGLADLPWYKFLFIPVVTAVMIIGGGLEEVGWRGFLQPSLEKKLPIVVAILLTGIIWDVWHLPLWFIQGVSQSSFNFWGFALYNIVVSFILVAAYKLTHCVFTCVLLHAWTNVLSGIFIENSLTSLPGVRLMVIYLLEVIASLLIIYLAGKKAKQINVLKESNSTG